MHVNIPIPWDILVASLNKAIMKSLCVNMSYMSLNISLRQILSSKVPFWDSRYILLNCFSGKLSEFALWPLFCLGWSPDPQSLWIYLIFHRPDNALVDRICFHCLPSGAFCPIPTMWLLDTFRTNLLFKGERFFPEA